MESGVRLETKQNFAKSTYSHGKTFQDTSIGRLSITGDAVGHCSGLVQTLLSASTDSLSAHLEARM